MRACAALWICVLCVHVGCYLYLLDVEECFIQVTYKLQMRERKKWLCTMCLRASSGNSLPLFLFHAHAHAHGDNSSNRNDIVEQFEWRQYHQQRQRQRRNHTHMHTILWIDIGAFE